VSTDPNRLVPRTVPTSIGAVGPVGPAFEGVRVLELDAGLAGAYCGHLLSLLGADVVKVESGARPSVARTAGPFVDGRPDADTGGAHVHLDARKRSIALNVTTPSGRALFDRLAGQVDVVVDDGVLGAPPEVRACYDALLAANRGLVVVALSPYGLDGPKAHYRSSELCDLAASGWLTRNSRYPDRAPLMPGSSCAELGLGTLAALGAVLALRWRRTSGVGQLVEVPRQEGLLSLLAFPTTLFAWLGVDEVRIGDRFPFMIVACADGHLGVSILTQRHWEALCRFMERPDLLERPHLANSSLRARPEAAEEITNELRTWFADKPAMATFEAGQAMRVPISIIPSPAEVLASPQYQSRDYWLTCEDPALGPLRRPGPPYRASEGTFAAYRPAPRVGQHTGELLDEWGIPAADRLALAALGVLA
jgi:crotonobetainyl-CoA:carnitine CoA-transferase CaiB-like acyl-CoA transferase